MIGERFRQERCILLAQLSQLDADRVATEARTIWAQSDEENLRPMDGSGLAARDAAKLNPDFDFNKVGLVAFPQAKFSRR